MPPVLDPTLSPKKFHRRFVRRLRDLLKKQRRLVRSCHRHGAAAQFHELRTCTRRLRVMLNLAASCLGRERTRRAIQHTRKISRITSRLRDLDVTLGLLAGRSKRSQTIAVLQRRRRALWRRHRRELLATAPTFPGSRRIKRLKKCDAKLLRRYERKLERLRSRLLAPIADFGAWPIARQHDFRRTVRRLRYLRELGLPRRRMPDDSVCQILIRTQGAIGGLLDAAVCRREIADPKQAATAAPAAIGPASRRIAGILEKLQSILARWKVTRAR